MSAHREDETVDAFGRTVVVSPRHSGNTGRTVVAAAPAREVRVAHGDSRGRGYSRFDEQAPPAQQNYQHHDRKPEWDGNNRGVRYQEQRRDDYGGNNRRQGHGSHHGSHHATALPYNPDRISPILSFKSFITMQRDDLPSDAYQRMYDQYHLNYLQDFSDRFFKESMMEEWFQDRYSPVRIQAQEEAAAARAVAESASLKASLLAHPVASVKAMCLDPPPHPKGGNKRNVGGREQPAQEAPAEPAAEAGDGMEVAVSDVPVASKHLAGHEDRTLYISGIHASCTRSALHNAILHALAPPAESEAANDAEEICVPERFLFAQPVWTNFDGNDKFERFAWIVMPTVAAAKVALRKLSELRVEVPFPLEPADTEPAVEFAFTVHARPHMPKVYYEKYEGCSHFQRVEADTARALEIAALLDEDRKVAEETRLAAVLEESAVQAALVKPTDKLDVAIAYLRRVHLVNFYGAKRFRDESHLLSMSPSVPHRIKEYVAPPPPSESTVAMVEEDAAHPAEEAPVPAPSVGGKRKHSDEDEEGETGSSSAEIGAGDMVVESGSAVKPPAPPSRPNQRPVNVANPRIESMLVELREKVAHSRRRAENPELPGTPDEEDAKILGAQLDQTFHRCVVQNLKPEKDDKCRCCYVTCNKLFKGADFLSKHMRLKHEDFAADLLLKDAEPFMRRRFEAEPMGARPLPPVEVEAHGRTELKSVKAILDKFMPQVAVGAVGGHRREDAAGARRASGGEGRRGQDERDRRGAGPGQGGSSGAPVRQQVQYVEPKPEDNHSRKISSYIDVDAPKESAVSIEYGVALPPIKKRKTAAAVKKTTSMDEEPTA